MKKKTIRRSLSLLCSLALIFSISCAAGATDRYGDTQKTEMYEAYLEIIEVKSAQYDIGFIPVPFDRFNLDESQLKSFEDMWDCLGALQLEASQVQTDVLPSTLERASGQSVSKSIKVTVGGVQLTMWVSGTFYTKLDTSRGVQIFDSTTAKPTAEVAMPKGYKWTETANNSGVSSANKQQYVASMQGKITGIGTGTFTGINVTATFYCSDTGVVS